MPPDSGASAVLGSGGERFWDAHQPGFRFTRSAPGSREFFADVAAARYELEPHIPEIVRFERWRDCDVLEAGCGLATDGVRFVRAGARYTGLDASPPALELARRRFDLDGLEGRFVEGAVTELPFADESFDLVYSHGVIHHVEEAERAIGELHRVLRPGGTVLAMVYHRGSLNYRVTIMGLRRLLAVSLLVPGAAAAVARLTGESRETLEGHRRLLRRHGLRYVTDRRLFLSNNTDGPGNPLSRVYTRAEARELFDAFEEVRVEARHLNLRIYPGGAALARTRLAHELEPRFGWHLYVEGRRPTQAPSHDERGEEQDRGHA